MTVLLLRLAAPLQSWGVDGRYSQRTTAQAPTKSGVVGLIAAAQGRRRSDPIEDLTRLRFGVRLDVPGTLLRDFHTASRGNESLPTAEGKTRKPGEAVLTHRFYLEDAVFLAALESDFEFLTSLDEALRRPQYPLFLGRRACPPTGPVTLGLRDGTIEEVFASEPWSASPALRSRTTDATLTIETIIDDPQGTELVNDHPITFDDRQRSWTQRIVTRSVVTVPHPEPRPERSAAPAHDPFALLEP